MFWKKKLIGKHDLSEGSLCHRFGLGTWDKTRIHDTWRNRVFWPITPFSLIISYFPLTWLSKFESRSFLFFIMFSRLDGFQRILVVQRFLFIQDDSSNLDPSTLQLTHLMFFLWHSRHGVPYCIHADLLLVPTFWDTCWDVHEYTVRVR